MNNLPTTPTALRIAALFNRRPTTGWDAREVKQYKKLAKQGAFNDPADLGLIEAYYSFERRKEDKGIHRRDLGTFLNNFMSELDRARAWRKRYPIKNSGPKQDREIRIPSDKEWEDAKDLVANELKRFREQMKQRV